MAWTCAVCTFANKGKGDNESRCEICETERGEAPDLLRHEILTSQSKSAASLPNSTPSSASQSTQQSKPGKATVQSTLFGSILTKKEESKNPKKRKAEKEAPIKSSSLQTNSLSPKASIDSSSMQTNSLSPKASMNSRSLQPKSLSPKEQLSACAPKDTPYSVLWALAQKKMNDVFKIQELRYLQPAAVECALRRQSQMIVMATGGGKSLCFQLPAVVLGGTTIVISPLIALMADQTQALLDKGIAAAAISSSNGERQNLDVMERLLGRSLRASKKISPDSLKPVTLLYCTPEQIQTDRFRNILTELYEKHRLALFAVDEAHCVSSWGHDFRPAYRKLGWLRDSFPDVPCMACTATATPKVIEDIRATLRLKDCPCHVGSFDRGNIRYKVRYKDALDQTSPRGAKGDLLDFVLREHQQAKENSACYSGIVYVHKRQDTTELAKEITKTTGIVAAAYHGGLKDAERERVQQSWTAGDIQIAIATVAFGMGIDLSHVRYVVHWSMAKSIESFYQESGRAGRDGLPSSSVLYYSKSDVDKFSYLINQRKKGSKKGENDKSPQRALDDLQKMVDYCIKPGCRRQRLLAHFGERNRDPKSVCRKNCDFCKDPKTVEKEIEEASASNDFSFHTRTKAKAKPQWDGQWGRPLGDDDSDFAEADGDWDVDGLNITGKRQFGGYDDDSASWGKPSAAAVLSKFEALEEKGFVRFKKAGDGNNTTKTSSIILVSEHIRAKLPDPLSHYASKEPAPIVAKSSADSLREELAKLKAERESQTPVVQAVPRKRAAPPPPPPISFGRKKR